MKRLLLLLLTFVSFSVCSAQYARLRNIDQQLFFTQNPSMLAIRMSELGKPLDQGTEDGIYTCTVANVSGAVGIHDKLMLMLEISTGAQAYYFSSMNDFNPSSTIETRARMIARCTRNDVYYKYEPVTVNGRRKYEMSIAVCNELYSIYYSPEKDGYTYLY